MRDRMRKRTIMVVAGIIAWLVGCGGADQRAPRAMALPSPGFTWSPDVHRVGQPTTFTANPDTCQFAPCRYEWRFRGETTIRSTASSWTWTWGSAGMKEPQLTVWQNPLVYVQPLTVQAAGTATPTPTPTPPPAGALSVCFVGDGDSSTASAQLVTAMRTRCDRAVYLGDVYLDQGDTYARWGPVWADQFPDRMLPTIGNHEYPTRGNTGGYYPFWRARTFNGVRFTDEMARHYAWDTGTGWRVLTVSSENPTSEEAAWMSARLGAENRWGTCNIPASHAGAHAATDDLHTADNPGEFPLWNQYPGKATVAVDAHSHVYHDALVDDANASTPKIRRFTVGTGGRGLRPLGAQHHTDDAYGLSPTVTAFLRLQLTRGQAVADVITASGTVRRSRTITCAPGAA